MTPAQCRAGRAMLDWTQTHLATRAKVGVVSIITFESGQTTPRPETLKALQRAMERAGIVFVDGTSPGVRMRAPPARARLHDGAVVRGHVAAPTKLTLNSLHEIS